MISLSVVVPVYNAEKTISECIDSIKKQKLDSFKCFLIDDGSTDNSKKIIDSLIENDSRFVYVFKENGGVSSARNLGISMVDTEFVVFIDSDDIVAPDYLSSFLENKDKADLVISGLREIYSERSVDYSSPDLLLDKRSFEKILLKYLTLPYIGGPYNKLFSVSKIKENNITFELNQNYAEDYMFNVKYFKVCNSFYLINQVTYFYDKTVLNSLSKKQHDSLALWERRKEIYNQFRLLFNNEEDSVLLIHFFLYNTVVQNLKNKNILNIVLRDYNNCYRSGKRKLTKFMLFVNIFFFYINKKVLKK